jgi:Fe-S-cluster containining protein
VLSQKVRAIEEVFTLLDEEIAAFRNWSGLSCKSGCGRCCTKADIEASVLEFLPFAHYVYQEGHAQEWLEKLRPPGQQVCLFFNPGLAWSGICSQYPHRGLICRLFGFSARIDKHAKRELVTCNVVKTGQPETYASSVKGIENGESVPVIGNYYMRLHAIDPDLAQKFYPINEAILRAIETVLHYYAYRE